MKKVGLRELKNRLSHYIRHVRAGRAVLVTDRGQVVAELLPPRAAVSDANGRHGLAGLAGRGVVSLGARNHPKLYPPMPPRLARGELKRLLDQERGER